MSPMRAINPLSGSDTRTRIAANVRAELARAGVSANSMAHRIGVARSSFSRRTTGDASFSAEEIVAIADELEIKPGVLLEVPAHASASAA